MRTSLDDAKHNELVCVRAFDVFSARLSRCANLIILQMGRETLAPVIVKRRTELICIRTACVDTRRCMRKANALRSARRWLVVRTSMCV